MRKTISLLIVASIPVISISGASRAGVVRYIATDLGTLPGDTISVAGSVNGRGDVVGTSGQLAGGGIVGGHGFLYHNGSLTDLGVPFGDVSNAAAINNSGQILMDATSLQVGVPGEHSYIVSNGTYADIGNLGGPVEALAINDAGQVTGFATVGNTGSFAFLYTNGKMQNLGALPGMITSQGHGINNVGQVVGFSEGLPNSVGQNPPEHAFLYSDGVMHDLSNVFGQTSIATAINDKGQIVGGGGGKVFLYSGGTATEVDGNYPGAYAWAVNNVGVAVGNANFIGLNHAAIYQDGGITDLNTLIGPSSGLTLVQALGINDAGQIVGSAVTASGDTHAFLLTPVPETALVAVVACTAILLRRHRSNLN